ncbi:MAG: hypothetical protein LBN95_12410 [Prevotellaceae bacterium]|nr:hypothetical protein [Prevotellaceae bacterium]
MKFKYSLQNLPFVSNGSAEKGLTTEPYNCQIRFTQKPSFKPPPKQRTFRLGTKFSYNII